MLMALIALIVCEKYLAVLTPNNGHAVCMLTKLALVPL
jgi:hypothetical protein